MSRSVDEIKFKPIGVIHSPFKEPRGTPIQPTAGKGVRGVIEVFPEYVEGLKDLEGFSHIILLYYFHLSRKTELRVKPFMDNKLRGVFSTRAPNRPNPIGVSVVRLLRVEGNRVHIQGLDIVDGTPLLDIKPYVPEFDMRKAEKVGWLEKNLGKLEKTRDDGRFVG
ncbi:MAG: tRNA (N6-threonylcarbamoyladenosine(37)-N6)-methyltransferase TrmO [Methanobacteriota archaeon]|nr:MAG: tRNA (N6-threonylcarbamoyladenosine(37)-N6)-methyltransferase TrmO [Euryarchaeota archaeon]